ncbi:DUF3040 domain-containing protein [Actinomycetospora lemnae]|uniref:DUF3040 domain-containing protein n=1 Tax=Actinomycetospora lemnae TaxID=3019891 RepID=A0ABT5SR77_9PSEU|nr:DUF3040 domain-containing protein [Actinomycetospora sp. DW7H6]MDD7965347.1 DUF3040 domain-containing protein [Actinomycetospora sp. DW7H6]
MSRAERRVLRDLTTELARTDPDLAARLAPAPGQQGTEAGVRGFTASLVAAILLAGTLGLLLGAAVALLAGAAAIVLVVAVGLARRG